MLPKRSKKAHQTPTTKPATSTRRGGTENSCNLQPATSATAQKARRAGHSEQKPSRTDLAILSLPTLRLPFSTAFGGGGAAGRRPLHGFAMMLFAPTAWRVMPLAGKGGIDAEEAAEGEKGAACNARVKVGMESRCRSVPPNAAQRPSADDLCCSR